MGPPEDDSLLHDLLVERQHLGRRPNYQRHLHGSCDSLYDSLVTAYLLLLQLVVDVGEAGVVVLQAGVDLDLWRAIHPGARHVGLECAGVAVGPGYSIICVTGYRNITCRAATSRPRSRPRRCAGMTAVTACMTA